MASTTLTSRLPPPSDPQGDLMPALAIVWYPAEPSRVGEVALLPCREPAPTYVFGRFKEGHHDTLSRLQFGAQRPGAFFPRPLRTLSARISKAQAQLHALGVDAVRVAVEGKAPTFVNGGAIEPGTSAAVRLGDTLTIADELLLLCVVRPRELAPLEAPPHAFGAPDAHGLVGESPCLWRLREDLAHRAELTQQHVLVLGPTGSGKELVAHALHSLSARPGKYVPVNSAGMPDGMLESRLFGHVRGAFTDAVRDAVGSIQEAHDGTLFLDEIAELSGASQAKLLRFLESGEIQRVGESTARHVNTRVVAATWRGPDELRADLRGRFRLTLAVPALAERREDVPFLVADYLKRQGGGLTTTLELMDALVRHDYMRGIRELQELLLLALRPAARKRGILAVTDELQKTLRFAATTAPAPAAKPATATAITVSREQLRAALDQHDWDLDKVEKALGVKGKELARLRALHGLEKRVAGEITAALLRQLLTECGNNVKQVQLRLGISRDQLRALLQKFRLDR